MRAGKKKKGRFLPVLCLAALLGTTITARAISFDVTTGSDPYSYTATKTSSSLYFKVYGDTFSTDEYYVYCISEYIYDRSICSEYVGIFEYLPSATGNYYYESVPLYEPYEMYVTSAMNGVTVTGTYIP